MSTEQLRVDTSYRDHFPYLDESGNIILNAREGDEQDAFKLEVHRFKHQIMSESMSALLHKIIKDFPDFEHRNYLWAFELLGGKLSLDSRRLPRCFTIRKDGVLTCLPASRDCKLNSENGRYISDLTWSKKGRVEVVRRWGPALRHLWEHVNLHAQAGYSHYDWVRYAPREIPDSVLESIVNLLQGYFTEQGTFDLVEGETIRDLYNERNYDQLVSTGYLANSCLRYDYDHVVNCLDLYVDNPSVKLLVLRSPFNTKLIRARALVWTGVTIEVDGKVYEDQTFLDRIYGTDAVIQAFKKYAREQGWWCRAHQTHDDAALLNTPKGRGVTARVTTGALLVERPQRMPFLDTLFMIAGHSWEDKASRTGPFTIRATFSNQLDADHRSYFWQSVPDDYEYDETWEEQDYWDKTTGPKWLKRYFREIDPPPPPEEEEVVHESPPQAEVGGAHLSQVYASFWQRVIEVARSQGYLAENELEGFVDPASFLTPFGIQRKLEEALLTAFGGPTEHDLEGCQFGLTIGGLLNQNVHLGLVALEERFRQRTNLVERERNTPPVEALIRFIPRPSEQFIRMFHWGGSLQGHTFWKLVHEWQTPFVQETLGACELALTYDNARLIEQGLRADPQLYLEWELRTVFNL